MLPVLLLLFIVVPLLELYVILQVGEAIGVLPTIAILMADSILGAVLMRSQGRLAWTALQPRGLPRAASPPARRSTGSSSCSAARCC